METNTIRRTRSLRDPSKYNVVTDWGWVHVPWPDFVKSHPQAAKEFVAPDSESSSYLDGWDEEEIRNCGGSDVTKWDALWDDEIFLTPTGLPVALCNLTGPGGCCEFAYREGVWDEVLLDDNGNVEEG